MEFTKEQLIAKAREQIEFCRNTKITGEGRVHVNQCLALFEIALASLEAEPVAYVDPFAFHNFSVYRAGETDNKRMGREWMWANPDAGLIPVYTTSPVPVSVPDVLKRLRSIVADPRALPRRKEWISGQQYSYVLLENVEAMVDDACRAAMLQGADTELQRKAEVHDALCEKYNVEALAYFVEWQRNHIAELEAAPPAPVGLGETAVMPDYPGCVMTQRECFQAGVKVGMERSAPALQVWYGAMPETNGKTNWTAMLHRKGQHMWEGITIDRSEYPDRVRYEADRMRHLIGELADEPDILAYDAEAHSGYVYPGNSPVIPDGWVLVPVEPTYQMCEAMGLPWESPRFPDRYRAMIAAAPHFREISNSSTKHFRENAETSTKCWCHTCRPVTNSDMRFVVCPDCGNKRCPHANDHRNACTGSNEPGQEGSAYPAAPQQEVK